MHLKNPFLLAVLLWTMMVSVAGCARMKPDYTASNASPSSTPAASASPVPKDLKPADLAKLRWIEGSWRGTGADVPAFYERYKFENDSTLAVETLADETFSKVTDTSRFKLKDGHFGYNTGDSGSVATALDDNSITFEPLGKARNSFRWQRESANSWKAILKWTDKSGAPKERVYDMVRWSASGATK